MTGINQQEKVHKGHCDNAEYRIVRLKNGIIAVLSSESNLDMTGASMSVAVGHYHDPAERPGTAHFLEHMLFMGTVKYPNENEFMKFLAAHGGNSNAYTDKSETNYHFQVSPEGFSGAFDRFASFFACPLLSIDGVSREMNAVDNEHSKNLNQDNWRIHQLMSALSKKSHPMHKFGTGSKETLGDKEGVEPSYTVMRRFYDQNYSPSIMTLFVHADISLDDQERLVRESLDSVYPKPAPTWNWDDDPFDNSVKGKLVRMRSVQDSMNLVLKWVSSETWTTYRTNPSIIVEFILGHEGPGSIQSVLKARGLSVSLGASVDCSERMYSLVSMDIELTKEGYANPGAVLGTVESYLESLKRMTDSQLSQYCAELREIKQISFDSAVRKSTIEHVRKNARNIAMYGPSDVMRGPYLLEEFDLKLVRSFLSRITLDSCIAILMSQEDIKCPEREQWYGTEYKVVAMPKLEPSAAVCLPKENQYYPVSVKYPVKEPSHPKLVASEGIVRVFHKTDDTFFHPNVYMALTLQSNFASNPVTQSALSLFNNIIAQDFMEHSYDASLYGCSLTIHITQSNLVVVFYSLTPMLGSYTKNFAKFLLDYKLTEQKFRMYYDQMRRDLLSEMAEMPYTQSSKLMNKIIIENSFSCADLYYALENLTAEAAGGMLKKFLNSVTAVDALFLGQIHADDSLILVREFGSTLGLDLAKTRVASESISYAPSVDWRANFTTADVPNNSVDVWFPTARLTDVVNRTMLKLVGQIFGELFFNDLRTVQQLGYVVFLGVSQLHGSVGLRTLVQSTFDPDTLIARIGKFLDDMENVLNEMQDEIFQQYVSALVAKLLERPKNITIEGSRHFNKLLSRYTEFDSEIADAKYASTITKSDMAKFVRRFRNITDTQRKSEAQALTIVLESPKLKEGDRPEINEELLKKLLIEQENQIRQLRLNSTKCSLPDY